MSTWSLALALSYAAQTAPSLANSPQPIEVALRNSGGRRCLLEKKTPPQAALPEIDPNADPEDLPPPPTASYQPTEESVFKTCGGLGCIDDPASANPVDGICSLPHRPEDCAGAADPAQHAGLCGPAHVAVKPPAGIRGRRFMFTAQAILEIDSKAHHAAHIDTAIGSLFQLSLSKSKTRPLPDGGFEHYALPHVYLHGEVHVSKQRLGHEIGLIYKFKNPTLTRVGVTAYGVVWGPAEFVRATQYRFGPALHFELLNNLIVRGAWTPGLTATGPAWVISIEYAARLWDDFKN